MPFSTKFIEEPIKLNYLPLLEINVKFVKIIKEHGKAHRNKDESLWKYLYLKKQ